MRGALTNWDKWVFTNWDKYGFTNWDKYGFTNWDKYGVGEVDMQMGTVAVVWLVWEGG